MKKLKVQLDPKSRQKYVDDLLSKDGLSHVSEDSAAAYCPISLTQTPEEIKPYVARRQQVLMEQILIPTGIRPYDPSSSPFSPDKDLSSLPHEVYMVDSGKIAGARFFVGHNLTASTGFGVEVEKAVRFNRMAVILMDKKIRVSRMQPHRVIYLQYSDLEKQVEEFVKVFDLLLEYEPGMGFESKEPVLIGFHKETGDVVNLEKLVYETFPKLKYVYNGKNETVKLVADNPEIFYEYKI